MAEIKTTKNVPGKTHQQLMGEADTTFLPNIPLIAFERHKYLKRKIFSLVYHGVSYKTAKALAERLADGIFDDETKRLEEKAVEEERHSIDWLLI